MSFSLALAASTAWGDDFTSLAKRMHAASSPAAALDIVRNDPDAMADEDISTAIDEVDLTDDRQLAQDRQRIQSMVELRSLNEGTSPDDKATTDAKNIKSSPLYSDAGVAETNPWLGNALERLKNLRFNLRMPEVRQTAAPGSTRWIVVLMWCLLGACVMFLAYLAFRHFSWKGRLARKAKAVLEEDEPERSVDEWLHKADELASQGAYREAVRALYLACLLRFDEHRVARFDRRETNWEHLARIHRSARRPENLDFGAPTRAFDRIWYGKRVNGMADVDQFRTWYGEIVERLRQVPV